MTLNSVFFDHIDGNILKPNKSEVYRYLGYMLKDRNGLDDGVKPLVEEVCLAFNEAILPQAVYAVYPLKIEGDGVYFANQEIHSRDLSRFLSGCDYVYLFAATLGPKIDKEIQKHTRLNPVKALVMQATGAMFIEEYCDLLCKKIEDTVLSEGFLIKQRFSPGYGDVSLEVQNMFFSLLDCKHIGLSLMDSLIMAPEKSVTAFVGVKKA